MRRGDVLPIRRSLPESSRGASRSAAGQTPIEPVKAEPANAEARATVATLLPPSNLRWLEDDEAPHLAGLFVMGGTGLEPVTPSWTCRLLPSRSLSASERP